MGFIEYKIQRGDTLQSIAKEQEISVKELVDFHNENCGITNVIIANTLPIHLKFILLKKKISFETNDGRDFTEHVLDKITNREARYRTKQINVIKLNDVINAHSAIQCDYYLSLENKANEGRVATVKLDDSVYNFYTQGSEELADFIRASDTVKNRLVYALDDKGVIRDLLNEESLQQNWHRFKKQLPMNKFFQKTPSEVLEQIINAGNIEYNSKSLLLRNSNSNLFNKIIFSQYLTRSFENFEQEHFETESHFFPQISFKVDFETIKKSEDDSVINYTKKGKPRFVDIDKMILLYEKFYRPQIEFKFTDYIYDIEIDFSVSKEDGLINEASVNLSERIKNNMESQVLYELKKVEL